MTSDPDTNQRCIRTFIDKEWNRAFFGSRKPRDEDRPHIDYLRDWNPTNNYVQLFMETYKDDATFSEAIKFCQEVCPTDFPKQKLTKRGSAWLDDRAHRGNILCSPQTTFADETGTFPQHGPISHPSPDSNDPESEVTQSGADPQATSRPNSFVLSRSYPGPLTAQALYFHLGEKRFDHPFKPDADRRLIYIPNTDAYDILALTETARRHQYLAVKNAIDGHLGFQTALTVTVSKEGWSVFQMEMHLPIYVLRTASSTSGKSRSTKPHRGWMDLSFMSKTKSEPHHESPLVIHRAHITVVLCGSDETRWVAYCFEDTDYDEDREVGDNEFPASDIEMKSDQIVNGDVDANRPIWSPREYFLTVWRSRIEQVLNEWRQIVRALEYYFEQYSPNRFFAPQFDGTISEDVNNHTAWDWTQKTSGVVNELLQTLRGINTAWYDFTSPNGDCSYFRDLYASSSDPEHPVRRLLCHIDGAYNNLKSLEQRLANLERKCEKLAHHIQIRLVLESNRATIRNGSNAELTVLYISPVAIVSTFFAIPVPILSFERNALSFFVGILGSWILLNMLLTVRDSRSRYNRGFANFFARAKGIYDGDQDIVVKSPSGAKVLRRRSTHASFRSTK